MDACRVPCNAFLILTYINQLFRFPYVVTWYTIAVYFGEDFSKPALKFDMEFSYQVSLHECTWNVSICHINLFIRIMFSRDKQYFNRYCGWSDIFLLHEILCFWPSAQPLEWFYQLEYEVSWGIYLLFNSQFMIVIGSITICECNCFSSGDTAAFLHAQRALDFDFDYIGSFLNPTGMHYFICWWTFLSIVKDCNA